MFQSGREIGCNGAALHASSQTGAGSRCASQFHPAAARAQAPTPVLATRAAVLRMPLAANRPPRPVGATGFTLFPPSPPKDPVSAHGVEPGFLGPAENPIRL